MKKKIIAVVAAFALLVVPALALAPTAFAGNFKSGESVVVKEGETIDSTLFVGGTDIEIAGTVNGDVFCTGQNVTITGTVKGDVLCAGMNLKIGGTVEGDVRVAGQVVVLEGVVDGNASVASQNFTAEKGSKVRDLAAAGNTLVLNGEVLRDADLAAQSSKLEGIVGRNVEAAGERLVLGEKSETGGNVTHYSENSKTERRDGAQVAGKVTQAEMPKDDYTSSPSETAGGIIFMFLALLTAAMALVALFPRVMQRVSTQGISKPGTTALIGLAVTFLSPIFIIGLLFTGIGFLLGLVLLVAYALILLASGPVFSYFVGRVMLKNKTSNPLLYMLLGASLVGLLYFVPIVGPIVMLAAVLLGTGMLVREVMSRSAQPIYDFANQPAVAESKTVKATVRKKK